MFWLKSDSQNHKNLNLLEMVTVPKVWIQKTGIHTVSRGHTEKLLIHPQLWVLLILLLLHHWETMGTLLYRAGVFVCCFKARIYILHINSDFNTDFQCQNLVRNCFMESFLNDFAPFFSFYSTRNYCVLCPEHAVNSLTEYDASLYLNKGV